MSEKTSGGRRLWGIGFVLGAIGGGLILEVQPFAAVLVAVAWLALAYARPRPFGLAGAIVGNALAFLALLLTGSYSCASDCWWSLPYGPTHSPDVEVWRASAWQWIAASFALLAAGLALSAWGARRRRA